MTTITIPIEDARQVAIRIGVRHGLMPPEATLVAEDYLSAELSGIRTHGLLKLIVLPAALQKRLGAPLPLWEHEALMMLDGQREIGPLAARMCVDRAITKAKTHGIAFVGVRNISRYGRLAPYGERLARAGCIGIIANQGGLAIAPPAGITPVLGANPLCLAFPRPNGEPLVIDLSTSNAVWSEVILADVEGRELPPNYFMDAAGVMTTMPSAAYSVDSFAGGRGFALALALEVLCGALLGARLGRAVRDEYDLGYVFIALHAEAFWAHGEDIGSGATAFAATIATLAEDIHHATMRDPHLRGRLPGERSAATYRTAQESGILTIHPRLWERLTHLAEGNA